MIKKESYGKPVDIWACGVILYILLVGYPPFWDDDETRLYSQIKKGVYEYFSPEWDTVTQEAKNLIDLMLTLNPSRRITAAEALNHPWICNRDKFASVLNRQQTMVHLRKFNARRKLKGAILSTMFAARTRTVLNNLTNGVNKIEKEAPMESNNCAEFQHHQEVECKEQEIIKLTEQIVTASGECDMETLSNLCDPGITVFKPESLGNLLIGAEYTKFYSDSLNSMILEYSGYTNTSILHPKVYFLSEDAACISYVRLTQFLNKEGSPKTAQHEETRVWHRKNGLWLNVHFHQSINSGKIF